MRLKKVKTIDTSELLAKKSMRSFLKLTGSKMSEPPKSIDDLREVGALE